MKTELTREDLLKNISVTRAKLEEIKQIDQRISELYKEPMTGVQKKMLAAVINLSWIGVFAVMAINFVGYHLLLMPFLYWLFRGSKVSDRISKSRYKKQLDSNEKEIESLYSEKGEKEYELKTVSMLEREMHDIAMLREFETYIQTKQAITIEKCLELYKNSKVK